MGQGRGAAAAAPPSSPPSRLLLFLLLLAFAGTGARADGFVAQRFHCYSSTTPEGTGCWIVPNECYTTDQTCLAAIQWSVNGTTISFTAAVYNDDLQEHLVTFGAYYVAVGFSHDLLMGDDTVVVCATNSMGNSSVYIAWNDQHENFRLYEASEKLLSQAMVSAAGKIICQWSWDLNGYTALSPPVRRRIFDLSNPQAEYHIMLARGPADPYTFQVMGHSMASGLLFPFLSTETTAFCSPSCASAAYDWLTDFTQDHHFPQDTRQKLSLAHAILMLLATFVFYPAGIMSARFGKDYLHRCCRTFVWLQLHRICNLCGLSCVLVALLLICYQSNVYIFRCSATCDTVPYFRQLHAIVGAALGTLMLAQAMAGLCRPGVSAESRKAFNWVHTFNGYVVWIGCCTNCFLSLNLKKFNLTGFYGRQPAYVLIVGVCAAFLVFMLCEWIVHSDKFQALDPDRIQRFYNPTDPDQATIDGDDGPTYWPLMLVLFNMVSGLMIVLTMSIMLVKASRAAGFHI